MCCNCKCSRAAPALQCSWGQDRRSPELLTHRVLVKCRGRGRKQAENACVPVHAEWLRKRGRGSSPSTIDDGTTQQQDREANEQGSIGEAALPPSSSTRFSWFHIRTWSWELSSCSFHDQEVMCLPWATSPGGGGRWHISSNGRRALPTAQAE